MWRAFFLAIGAYCCLLGVEALATRIGGPQARNGRWQASCRRENHRSTRLGPLEPDGRRGRGIALFVHHSAARGRLRAGPRVPPSQVSPSWFARRYGLRGEAQVVAPRGCLSYHEPIRAGMGLWCHGAPLPARQTPITK